MVLIIISLNMQNGILNVSVRTSNDICRTVVPKFTLSNTQSINTRLIESNAFSYGYKGIYKILSIDVVAQLLSKTIS